MQKYIVYIAETPHFSRGLPKPSPYSLPLKKKSTSPSGGGKKNQRKVQPNIQFQLKKTKIHLPECCCLRGAPQSFPLFRCWPQNFQAVRVHHHVGENLDLVDCHEEPEIPLWQLQHLLNLLSLPQDFFWLATFEAERVYGF